MYTCVLYYIKNTQPKIYKLTFQNVFFFLDSSYLQMLMSSLSSSSSDPVWAARSVCQSLWMD